MLVRLLVSVLIVLFTALPASAQFSQALERLGLGRALKSGDTKISSGLKEALRIGTENAVHLAGSKNGYFGNEAIKISMPEKLRGVEQGLRAVGYGPRVDEFVLSMNRAAEEAAPYAKQIFLDALGEMTFEDARGILAGGNSSATQYFRRKTSEKLTTAFTPVVKKTMSEVGVVQSYEAVMGQVRTLPFVRSEPFDVTAYVVTKALDGLFHVLGEEERKIRTDPAARTTELLKDVFGK